MTTFVITGMVKYCWAQIKSQMIMRSVMYRQPGERLTFRQLESTSSSRRAHQNPWVPGQIRFRFLAPSKRYVTLPISTHLSNTELRGASILSTLLPNTLLDVNASPNSSCLNHSASVGLCPQRLPRSQQPPSSANNPTRPLRNNFDLKPNQGTNSPSPSPRAHPSLYHLYRRSRAPATGTVKAGSP